MRVVAVGGGAGGGSGGGSCELWCARWRWRWRARRVPAGTWRPPCSSRAGWGRSGRASSRSGERGWRGWRGRRGWRARRHASCPRRAWAHPSGLTLTRREQAGSSPGRLVLRRPNASKRESVPQAAPSLGPPRPIGRLGRGPAHTAGLAAPRSGHGRRAGQIGQLLEGQAGQFLTAASAMTAASGQPLKRGKITAVSSTPVMKEKSMDIRHRLRRGSGAGEVRLERLSGRGWARACAAKGTPWRREQPPELRLAAKPVPTSYGQAPGTAACAAGSGGHRAGHPNHGRAGSPCRPCTCVGTGRVGRPCT